MAVKIVKSVREIPGQEEEEEELNHSGTYEKGQHHYNKCPVKGGMLYNSSGVLVNARNQEIDGEGNVLNPEKYKNDVNPFG